MRYFFWAILYTVLLASCSHEEEPGNVLPMNFSVNISETRSSFIDGNEIPNETSIGVFASSAWNGIWNSSNATMDYIYNKGVIRKGNEYAYIPKEYWPTQPLKFFAYYPHDDRGSSISPPSKKGYPAISFSVADEIATQYELLAAVTGVLSPTAAVQLNLRHAMTRIGFSFRKANINTTVIVKTITLSGAISRGVLSFDENENITWSLNSAYKGSYLASINNGAINPISLSTQYTEITSLDGYLIMIPQPLAEGQILLTIIYSVNTEEKELQLELPQGEWIAGRYINYQITIQNTETANANIHVGEK